MYRAARIEVPSGSRFLLVGISCQSWMDARRKIVSLTFVKRRHSMIASDVSVLRSKTRGRILPLIDYFLRITNYRFKSFASTVVI